MAARTDPRDGGYAWVVMVAFFLLEVLVDGTRFSFGVYFVEFLEEFNRGKGETAWIGSLMVSMYNLSGPLFAVIVNKVGYRVASMVGSVITTVGFLLSYFATDVWHLYLTYGVLQGFGFGLIYLSGSVAVGRYFYRKRARAMGAALCGAGIGMFTFVPIMRYIIDKYTWRGSMFILAGISLNGCVMSALFRPIEFIPDDVEFYVNDDNDLDIQSVHVINGLYSNGKVINSIDDINDNQSMRSVQSKLTNGHLEHLSNGYIDTLTNEHPDIPNSGHLTHLISDPLPSLIEGQQMNISNGHLDKPTQNGSLLQSTTKIDSKTEHDNENGYVENGHVNPTMPLMNGSSAHEQEIRVIRPGSPQPRTFADIRREQLMPISHKAALGSQRSLRSVNLSVVSQSIFGSNASFEYMFGKRARSKLSMKSSQLIQQTKPEHAQQEDMTSQEDLDRFKNDIIETVFPKRLVKNINFQLMVGSCLFVGVPSFIPVSMLPDFAITYGATTSQAAWTLSAIGIGGTFSRIGGGWLADLPCVHTLTLLSGCFFGCGITTLIIAFMTSYYVIMVYSILYGIFFGAVYIVQPMAMLEYLGDEYIAEIMGLTMCVYGVANFIGSPMAGWLFDATGTYMVSFVVAGSLFIVGTIVNTLVLCTKRSREIRQVPDEVDL